MAVTAARAVGGAGGAAVGDGLGVTARGAGGVLANVGRANIMKGTIGAGGVFPPRPESGLSKSVAVGALRVSVSLCRFLDLQAFSE